MDAKTFDRLIAEAAQPSRRSALRFLAAGLLGGLLASRWVAPAAALQADRDGDGLFDDDETGVYGTNPDLVDSDGDGVGDGEEIYLGTDPLTPGGGQTLTGATGGDGCAAGLTDCGGMCLDLLTDPFHCGACGIACEAGTVCQDGFCITLGGGGCKAGSVLTYCAEVGVCVDLLTDPFHCGACGIACGIGAVCSFGGCVVGAGETYAEVACDPSLVNCGSACANLAFDPLHCGYCGNVCPGGDGYEGVCSFGVCSLTSPPANGGSVEIGDVNSLCEDVPLPPGCTCVINGQCVY